MWEIIWDLKLVPLFLVIRELGVPRPYELVCRGSGGYVGVWCVVCGTVNGPPAGHYNAVSLE